MLPASVSMPVRGPLAPPSPSAHPNIKATTAAALMLVCNAINPPHAIVTMPRCAHSRKARSVR
jgi:hypothetical protein